MNAYLPDWSSGLNYRFITGSKGLFGKWSFSSDAPSSAAFAAINALEEANGWPSAVVARNDIRRKAKKLIWLSPVGVSVGPRPLGDMIGVDAFTWLPSIRADGNESRMAPWGNPSVTQSVPAYYETQQVGLFNGMMMTGTCANQRLAKELYDGADLDEVLWREYFSALTHVQLQPGVAVASNTAAAMQYKFEITLIESLVEPGYLVCAVMLEGLKDPLNANSGAHKTVCYKCPSPKGMEGIRYLAYAPSYTSSWISNASAGSYTPAQLMTQRLQGVGAESVWKHLLLAVGGVTVSDAAAGVAYTAQQDLTTCFFRLYAPYADTPHVDYPRFRVGGFPGTGISVHEVIAYGQPEFVENFHILGAVTVNGNEIKVAEDAIVLDWVGDRLSELSAKSELTPEQLARLAGMRVRSVVSSRQRTISGPLVSKLSFARDASKADVDLNSEVMFVADDEQPALTFLQAEKMAVGKTFRSLHQLLTRDSVGDYSHLKLFGSVANPLTLGWSLHAGAVKDSSATVDDALNFIRGGGRVINGVTSATLSEALDAVLGVPLATFASLEIDNQAVGDFDEAKMFKDCAPNMDALSPSQYAGFALLHFGRNRSQMDSFVAAALSYGRYAHKKLVGGETIIKTVTPV